MWTCDTCAEEHEDQFSSCWKCDSGEKGNPSEELIARFVCVKCSGTDSVSCVHQLNEAALVLGTKSRYLAVTCQACAFTEFYNLDFLEE